MYPQGTASSQMVLRGMDLVLECIASGVYVQLTPPPLATLREDAGGGLCTLCSCHGLGGKTSSSPSLSGCFLHG